MGAPILRATAILNCSSSSLRPSVEVGRAFSQAPEWRAVAAKSLLFSFGWLVASVSDPRFLAGLQARRRTWVRKSAEKVGVSVFMLNDLN